MQNIGSGIAYTYGIDPQGKMYVYDKWQNKMMAYGDPQQVYDKWIIPLSVGHDAKLTFEGDKTNGAWQNKGTQEQKTQAPPTNTGTGFTGGGGYTAPVPEKPKLDQAQVDSLMAQLGNYDSRRDTMNKKAALKRDASLNEKKAERDKEDKNYKGKKLTTLQDFAGAKTDTDLSTAQTLQNLVSSLSTMGLGGSRALTRQILDAANQSNRKANATQATNNQGLDTAWNEYEEGYGNDVNKIKDQFDYDKGEAERQWAEDRQNTYYKIGDVYNAAEIDDKRQDYMKKGDGLNSVIKSSAFVNPRYDGKTRQMDAPDMADYTQDIAQYDTSAIGAVPGGLTPAGGDAAAPGNLAIKAMALNDRDLGVKKKTEAELGYGV